MPRPLVALQDTSLGYDGSPILEHVTLTIAPGDLIAVLGPNGAGKTTLLRALAGLLPVLTGRREYGFDRLRTPAGYLPQRESLDPIFPMTAHDVVVMGTYGRLRRLQFVGRRHHRAATTALARVGLDALSKHPFWTLSGGQKQRVLIARALAGEPPLIFLDEPTAGVDPEAAAAIMDTIVQLHREVGLAAVLVTHQFQLLRGAAPVGWWVEGGHVERATPEAIAGGLRRLEGVSAG
jgi:ABC-type Mn2+/Zn2+ transport system ATPase subunit